MMFLCHEEANLLLQKCLFGSLFVAVIAMTSIQACLLNCKTTIRNKSIQSDINVNSINRHADDMLIRGELFITTNCAYFKIHKTLVRNFSIDFLNHVNSFLIKIKHVIISH